MRGFLFSSSFLFGIRRKALKGRYWYRILDVVERGIFDLASRLFDAVHSSTLLVELEKIVTKLVEAGKSLFVKYVEKHGVKRIIQIVDQARLMGYHLSESLMSEGFMRYLMFIDFNQPIGWGIYPHDRVHR